MNSPNIRTSSEKIFYKGIRQHGESAKISHNMPHTGLDVQRFDGSLAGFRIGTNFRALYATRSRCHSSANKGIGHHRRSMKLLSWTTAAIHTDLNLMLVQ